MTSDLRAALALAGALALACCSSFTPDRPRPGGGPVMMGAAGFSGLVADPIALALSDFDADRDRRVTRAELEAGAEASWRELDADGDGQGSAFEFADWARAAMGSDGAIPGRVTFDRNADGRVSHAELVALLDAEFTRLDADGDGALARAELVRRIEAPRFRDRMGGEGMETRRRGPMDAPDPAAPEGR